MTPDGRMLQAIYDALVETIKDELSAQIHVRGVREDTVDTVSELVAYSVAERFEVVERPSRSN
jgi:hypothetical protein